MTLRMRQRGGWLLTEMVISIILLGMLMAAMVSIQTAAGRANHAQLARQRCIAAAQAALDSVAATGEPLGADDVERLWPGVSVEMHAAPGTGEWQGLTLLTATARGRSGGKEMSVKLRRYVLPPATGGQRQ